MLEYRVIHDAFSQTPRCLEERVNRAIADGWVPIGGVAVALVSVNGDADTEYAQAMVREVKETEE